ncbi:hypothetical protein ABZ907_45590 [Nonomuraea wenchangensis]
MSIQPGDADDQDQLQMFGNDEVQEAATAEQVEGAQAAAVQRPSACARGVAAEDDELGSQPFHLRRDHRREPEADVFFVGPYSQLQASLIGGVTACVVGQLPDLGQRRTQLLPVAALGDLFLQRRQARGERGSAVDCHELPPLGEEVMQGSDGGLPGGLLGDLVHMLDEPPQVAGAICATAARSAAGVSAGRGISSSPS